MSSWGYLSIFKVIMADCRSAPNCKMKVVSDSSKRLVLIDELTKTWWMKLQAVLTHTLISVLRVWEITKWEKRRGGGLIHAQYSYSINTVSIQNQINVEPFSKNNKHFCTFQPRLIENDCLLRYFCKNDFTMLLVRLWHFQSVVST